MSCIKVEVACSSQKNHRVPKYRFAMGCSPHWKNRRTELIFSRSHCNCPSPDKSLSFSRKSAMLFRQRCTSQGRKRTRVETLPAILKNRPLNPSDLRRRAEARLKEEPAPHGPPRTEADTKRLLHELQVHQLELEMQNSELREARDEIEIQLGRYTDLYDFAPVGYYSIN